jgi:hypothetical protein
MEHMGLCTRLSILAGDNEYYDIPDTIIITA